MKLVKTKNGFVFAFGFDMLERKPNPRMVCWCDQKTGEWEPKTDNEAGFNCLSFNVAPEFIQELGPNRMVAYQPGVMLELNYCGAPFIWSFNEQWAAAARAA